MNIKDLPEKIMIVKKFLSDADKKNEDTSIWAQFACDCGSNDHVTEIYMAKDKYDLTLHFYKDIDWYYRDNPKTSTIYWSRWYNTATKYTNSIKILRICRYMDRVINKARSIKESIKEKYARIKAAIRIIVTGKIKMQADFIIRDENINSFVDLITSMKREVEDV